MISRRRTTPCAVVAGLTLLLMGCVEERGVYRTPRLLENVAGVQEGGEDLAAKRERESRGAAKPTDPKPEPAKSDQEIAAEGRVTSESLDQTKLTDALGEPASPQNPVDTLVTVNPDGSRTLTAKNYRDVIALLSRVTNGEAELDEAFVDQLVHSDTKAHFRTQGKDPREGVPAFLHANRTPINKLLARLPGGENSPGVIVGAVGRNRFKLELTGPAAKGLAYTELWVGLEDGKPRFIWVR